MPTYEYRCPNGHQFDVFQRMSDEPVSECSECGATAERQISGGAGFIFKGDGFYITDYRSDEYKQKASGESPSSGSDSSDSSSSDSSSSSGSSSSGSSSTSSAGNGGSGSSSSTDASSGS